MALSDIEKEKDKRRGQRALDHPHARWSDQQKIDAVKSWMVLGNLAMVARLHSIPRITLVKWKECAWWHELVDELKQEEKIVLSSKMKSLVDAAHQVVANRLEAGDAVLNQKTGQIVYKPVSMKDAHRVAVDMLNQRQLLEKGTVSEAMGEGATEKLEALAEKFAEFVTKKIDKQRTVDVTDVEIKVAQNESLSNRVLSDDFDSTPPNMGEENQEQAASP
jgi:transposase-like protein